MKRSISALFLILLFTVTAYAETEESFDVAFAGRGLHLKSGIRNQIDFNAISSAPSTASSGDHILTEAGANITNEAGDQLITE